MHANEAGLLGTRAIGTACFSVDAIGNISFSYGWQLPSLAITRQIN